jgi:hypothetical protein
LRLYKEVKTNMDAELYVKLNLTSSERSMLAQLRMGILPIRIETGRFTNMKLSDRICQICQEQKVEDEIHFLFICDSYSERRQRFIRKCHP